MATTYELIASTTASGSSSTLVFSAIPQTYTDLVLRYSTRNSGTGTVFEMATSTGSWGNTRLIGNGSAASSSRTTSQGGLQTSTGGEPSSYTANTFNSGEIYMPNYTISQTRPFSTFTTTENNATGSIIQVVASLNTTAEAITTFTLYSSQNFEALSSFYLYGIKKS